MTATSHKYGWPIEYSSNGWIYQDTGESIYETERACQHCGKQPIVLQVTTSASDSHTGHERLDLKPVDSCLAPLVEALNKIGYKTRSSCCGHGKEPGKIILQDGTEITVPLLYTEQKGKLTMLPVELDRTVESLQKAINKLQSEVLESEDEFFSPPLEAGIKRAVVILRSAGINTFESCEGGQNHSDPVPTIRFEGQKSEGLRAVSIAMNEGLKVFALKRVWRMDDGELTGPWWEITFVPSENLEEKSVNKDLKAPEMDKVVRM